MVHHLEIQNLIPFVATVKQNQPLFSVRTAVMSLQNGWDSVRHAKSGIHWSRRPS